MDTTTHEVDEQVGNRGLDAAATAAQPPEHGGLQRDRDGQLQPEEEQVVQDATEWLLEAFDENYEVSKSIDLNVGTPTAPRWITWEIKSVDGAQLRRIRARAADSIDRSQRGKAGALGSAEAAYRANLEVVLEGTVKPDLRAVAAQRGIADPTVVVEESFKNKNGLVDQISAEIMSLSGYDDEDVRDSLEVRAAGNS